MSADERESSLRSLLNFGHTLGHAIETQLYPHALHGECVSVGMVLECEIARNLGKASAVTLSRLTSLLKGFELPTRIEALQLIAPHVRVSVDALMDAMALDKKNSGKAKKVVLLTGIGTTFERGFVLLNSVLLLFLMIQ